MTRPARPAQPVPALPAPTAETPAHKTPVQPKPNERQLRAIQFIQTSTRITNRDYRDLCPDVSAETLRLDFADMVDKGILLKVGDKKGTYYVLK